ncbi:MAG TPA: hypothetical protein PLB55_14540 [Prosthecobacter sp.]|nr:hypothetical protein [Prosthecobacter sp.]
MRQGSQEVVRTGNLGLLHASTATPAGAGVSPQCIEQFSHLVRDGLQLALNWRTAHDDVHYLQSIAVVARAVGAADGIVHVGVRHFTRPTLALRVWVVKKGVLQ